ncbi:MAG: hypothetical protein QNJ78_06135 [Gammaproteobacteria bacterium]|nr:hypothetical protein [Gammaproteobacteria bacterium]
MQTVKILELVLIGLLGAATLHSVRAEGPTVERDISEFVAAQGTIGLENDAVRLFVPPVPNFLTFTDPLEGLAMSIDYAGLADKKCEAVSGSTFEGKVTETQLPDGRAAVSVTLWTENATTWVLDTLSFNSAVILGARWVDVGGECTFDAVPTLGASALEATFIISEPGAPLPDLFAFVIIDKGLADFYPEQIPEGLELVTLRIWAVANGVLDDGTPTEAVMEQHWLNVDGAINFLEERIDLFADEDLDSDVYEW